MTIASADLFLIETILPGRAAGYSRRGETWVNSAYVDMSIPYAAGGLYSTVEDFYRWYQCWREQQILSASSWTVMTTGGKWDYGCGMWISEHFRRTTQKVLEHGGPVNGFATSMKWFPDADLFVAVCANWDSANTGDVAENLAAIMLDMPVTHRGKEIEMQDVPAATNKVLHATAAAPGS